MFHTRLRPTHHEPCRDRRRINQANSIVKERKQPMHPKNMARTKYRSDIAIASTPVNDLENRLKESKVQISLFLDPKFPKFLNKTIRLDNVSKPPAHTFNESIENIILTNTKVFLRFGISTVKDQAHTSCIHWILDNVRKTADIAG